MCPNQNFRQLARATKSTRNLRVDIPKISQLARATKSTMNLRVDIPKISQLARATKSTRILRVSLGEPGFSLFLPSYLGFECVLTTNLVSSCEQPNLPGM